MCFFILIYSHLFSDIFSHHQQGDDDSESGCQHFPVRLDGGRVAVILVPTEAGLGMVSLVLGRPAGAGRDVLTLLVDLGSAQAVAHHRSGLGVVV